MGKAKSPVATTGRIPVVPPPGGLFVTFLVYRSYFRSLCQVCSLVRENIDGSADLPAFSTLNETPYDLMRLCRSTMLRSAVLRGM